MKPGFGGRGAVTEIGDERQEDCAVDVEGWSEVGERVGDEPLECRVEV